MSFCKICKQDNTNNHFWVREMMIGTRHEFEYFQCSFCGCVQIKEYPSNIELYYPSNKYYSFDSPTRYFRKKWKNWLKGLRDFAILNTSGRVNRWLVGVTKVDLLVPVVSLLKIRTWHHILDVGCGSGVLLYALKNAGYDKVVGVDPFIEGDIHYKNGVRVLKQDIYEHKEKYDIVMMHHSLEHMPDPHQVFSRLHNLLHVGGRLLVRIPIVAFAWEYYGVDWVQLDAPRHFFIHSEKSIGLLAQQNGFRLVQTFFDSSAFQFWGSELYKKDIALTNDISQYFSVEELEAFSRKAKQLNKDNTGDQAAFIFEKI